MTEDDDLPFEQITNRDYLHGLERFRSQPIHIGTARSRTWLDEAPSSGHSKTRPGCLVGRIGLDIDDEHLGREFYVGVRYLSDTYFSHAVVGWDAPVARIFYDPEGADHELLAHVRIRRTMLSRGNEIVRLDDAWAAKTDGPAFSSRPLVIPQPPPRTSRSSSRRTSPSPKPPHRQAADPGTEARSSVADKASLDSRSSEIPRNRQTPQSAQQPNERLLKGMRSANSVVHALAAPRTRGLASVLATLQPDQYRLVTHPADKPLVVQGHPGTGKTVIAIHRAAYLVSSEREKPAERLLFIGPTNAWANHVESALRSLAEREVVITSVPVFLAEAASLPAKLHGDLDYSVDEVDARLSSLAQAVTRLIGTSEGWADGKDSHRVNVSAVYTAIRYGSTVSRIPIAVSPDLSDFTTSLPSFGAAMSTRRLQPFLAAISIAVRGAPRSFDHIIVDEAQDVSPLTWEVIKAHSSGGVTIVGDMNQRRNDVGHASWPLVVDQLSLTEDGAPTRPVTITRGYRSTQAILNFAKSLLPASQRDAQSLQAGGIPPTVRRATTAKARNGIVEEEAERLCSAYPNGQVAIIVPRDDLEALETDMLKKGWLRKPHHVWTKDGNRTKVVTPTTARGIEFDAVVVVEPGAFPRNLGRVGQLYTSLTRANRELSVVHHRRLPDELRRHGRG